MYVGRIVAAGRSALGMYVGYRVSSRSYKNRHAVIREDIVSILPTAEDPTGNPYISYNCLRETQGIIVATNGSQTDSVVEKIGLGYPPRDALALSLLALDFEKDNYKTPRIAACVDTVQEVALLAIICHDRLHVREFKPEVGQAFHVATYEVQDFTKIELAAEDVDTVAHSLITLDYEFPVCATAAAMINGKLTLAVDNG